jgi:hypothetical protein
MVSAYELLITKPHQNRIRHGGQRFRSALLRYARLPAPARIASTPAQSSSTSWNPAVPPPPVPGAAVGNELADGLGDGDGLGLGVAGVGVAGAGVAGVGVCALGSVTPGGAVLGVVVPGGAALCVLPPAAPVLGLLVAGALVPGALVLGVWVLGALPEVVMLGVPAAVGAGVAAPVRPGENDGGVVGGGLDEQALTVAVVSRARTA